MSSIHTSDPSDSNSQVSKDGATQGLERSSRDAPVGQQDGDNNSDAPTGSQRATDSGEECAADALLRRHRTKHTSMLPDAWRIELPVFEGPLDLLLHLIRINEVEIAEIPVAVICDQYHEYLNLMEKLDLDVAGEYIYEAAVLIQLKSRLLLPQPKVEEGEELPQDPREELVQRLLEYQRIKEAAQTLAEVSGVRSGLWVREKDRRDVAATAQDGELEVGDLSLFDLLKVFRIVLSRYDREHPPEIVLRSESFSVKGQIRRLLGVLGGLKPVELSDDLLALSCRSEAIAAFLAILELCKLQLIRLHTGDDGEVLIFRTTRELVEAELEGVTT